MKISIIVPTLNRSDQLSRTLKSLVCLNFETSNYEIIVVDNGSTDNTKHTVEYYIKEYDDKIIKYIYDDVPGLLTGRHRGANEANGEILVFVDDDIQADKNWLKSICNTFDNHTDVQIVGGKCLPKFEISPPKWLRYFWKNIPGEGKMLQELSLCDFGNKEKGVDPTWVWGLNFSIKKDAFIRLGGFNPDCIPYQYQYFQGDGETGLSIRARDNGCKAIYQPKAVVYHEVPSSRMSIEYFDKRYFYSGICNSYTEIRRNHGIKNYQIIVNIIKKYGSQTYRSLIKIFRWKSQSNIEKEMLLARFTSMENAGYEFHQKMVRNSSIVHSWVLKENYFDYDFRKLLKNIS